MTILEEPATTRRYKAQVIPEDDLWMVTIFDLPGGDVVVGFEDRDDVPRGLRAVIGEITATNPRDVRLDLDYVK